MHAGVKGLLALFAISTVALSCTKDAIAPVSTPGGGGGGGGGGPVTAVVRETEPNNSLTNAKLIVLGDTIVGAVDPYLDDDYYAIVIPAGTRLRIDRQGSHGRVEVSLFDVDGHTYLMGMLEYEEIVEEFPISHSGRYYVLVNVWDHDDPYPDNIPTPGFTYSISLAGAEQPL